MIATIREWCVDGLFSVLDFTDRKVHTVNCVCHHCKTPVLLRSDSSKVHEVMHV